MTDRRRIEYRSDLDTREFEAGARTMKSRFQDMGKGLQDLGVVGFGQLSQAIGYSARDLVSMGIDMAKNSVEWAKMGANIEQVARSFDTIFGSAAASLRLDLDETRRSMGLSRSEMESMLLPMGQMATNAGYAGDAAGELSGKLLTMAGDVAAFNPLIGDSTQALGAMQAALRGEFDPLERFGSKLSAARVKAEATRLKGIDPMNASLTEQQLQIQAVVSLLEQDFAPALGTLEKQEGTATDSANELTASMKDMQEQGYKLANQVLPPLLNNLADMTQEQVEARESGNLLGQTVNNVKNALGFIASPLLGVKNLFSDTGSAIGGNRAEAARLNDYYRNQIVPTLQTTRREISLTKDELEAMARKSEEFRSRAETAFSNVQAAWDRMQLTPKRATLDIVSIGIGDDRPVGIGAPEYQGRTSSTATSSWNSVNGAL